MEEKAPGMSLKSALLYTALGLLANQAAADAALLEALRTGPMRALTVHSDPRETPASTFDGEDGGQIALSDYGDKVLMLNFWATWCVPCREEMPALAELQEAYGGDDFEVVTIATGRNPPEAMTRFFDEIGVESLPLHRDPRQQFAREMGVLGLPVTVLLDRDGMEVARLQGGADWASDEARAVVEALLDAE